MITDDYKRIGYSDYWDVYLKRIGEKIQLKRFTPVDFEYMEEYINDRVDFRSEWQDDVQSWYTEDWYDTWRDNYEYHYQDYFSYDDDTDQYYDYDSDDTLQDTFYTDNHSKEDLVEEILDMFNNDYTYWHFERLDWMNVARLRTSIEEFYDNCREFAKEKEEARKPHWNVFNYYK